MKLAWVLTGFLAVIGIMIADYLIISEVQNEIMAMCDAHISFDKSGDMYCVDSSQNLIRLGQK
jgi:hypothetical protein